jgi:hypothetical protein
MSKVITSFAHGEKHNLFLDVARRRFLMFAELHGYDPVGLYMLPQSYDRPPSWWKIPHIMQLLKDYDEVLWVDADMVIIDHSEDLNVPPGYWQAMVEHHTPDGDVPGCGFWLLRRAMVPYLDAIWGKREFIEHPWWEQRAVMQLMGYRKNMLGKHRQVVDSHLFDHTHFLDGGWNVHIHDNPQPENARVMHATQYTNPLEMMKRWDRTASP